MGMSVADIMGIGGGPKVGDLMAASIRSARRANLKLEKVHKDTWTRIDNFTKKPVKPIKEMAKWMKKADPIIKSFGKGFKAISTMGLDAVGIFLQFADAIGLLEPIMQILTGILQVIGGAAMEKIGPALADFAEILFSDDMMDIWQLLGEVIGDFVAGILRLLADLFSDPEFKKLMEVFIKIFANVFAVIMDIFEGIITWLSGMSASELGALFFALGVGIAFLMGVLHGGPLAPYLSTLYAGLAVAALMPLLSMQYGGITTGVTMAMLHPHEAVIPLDSEKGTEMIGGNNEELLWATEDNGRKMDRLIGAIETSNRIARLSVL